MGPGAEWKIFLRGHGGFCGCGSLAVTECELRAVHKLGAAGSLLDAGVIGGYRGVTAGLRGAFLGFAGGFVQYCGGGVFGPFPEKCSKFLRGRFWAVGGNVFKISGLHFFDILNTVSKIVRGADAQFFDILNTAPEIVGVRVCTFLTFWTNRGKLSKIEPAESPCPSRVPRVRRLGRY